MSMVVATVPVDAVGAALQFPSEILRQLASYGVIAGRDDSLVDFDDATRVVEDLRRVISPVVSTPILISKAATKYGFTPDSIYNWIMRGWVKVLVDEPRRKIDEGDVALAKALTDLHGGHRAGRAVFPSKPRSGRPKKPRT
ncbi:MAG: hypothetical protein WCP31_02535 [Chloroflexales bacterium]